MWWRAPSRHRHTRRTPQVRPLRRNNPGAQCRLHASHPYTWTSNRGLICRANTTARLHHVYWPLGQHSRAQEMIKMRRMRTLLGFGFLAIVLLLAGVPARGDESLAITLVPVNDLPRADDV